MYIAQASHVSVAGLHAVQERVWRWIKPPSSPLVPATFADLTIGKAELLAENARFALPTDHLASTDQTTSVRENKSSALHISRSHGSGMETGTLYRPAGDESREGRVSSSVCSPKHTSKAQSSKPKLSHEIITFIREMAANNRRLSRGAHSR